MLPQRSRAPAHRASRSNAAGNPPCRWRAIHDRNKDVIEQPDHRGLPLNLNPTEIS
jgi:hypothetical protein